MKNIAHYLVIAFGALLPASAFAAPTILDGLTGSGSVPTGLSNVSTRINNLTNFALLAAGIVSVAVVIWSGFTMITSGGDPDKVTSARKILTAGVIGLILVIAAKGIAMFFAITLPGIF